MIVRDEMKRLETRYHLPLFLKEDMERVSLFRPASTLLPAMPALGRVSMQKMPFAGMVNPGEASGKMSLGRATDIDDAATTANAEAVPALKSRGVGNQSAPAA